MKITDLTIDPRSLGNKLWLVEVSPAYEYQNNRRTDTVLGGLAGKGPGQNQCAH